MAKSTKQQQPEEKPEAAETTAVEGRGNGNGKTTEDMVAERLELFSAIKENLTALQDKLKFHQEQIKAISVEIQEVRNMLPAQQVEEEPEEDEEPASRQRAAGRGRRGRGGNESRMREMLYNVLKKAGPKGLTKLGLTEGLLEAGYKTSTVKNPKKATRAELEKFARSVYASGINKLLNPDSGPALIENFRVPGEGRESRYRVTK